LESKLDNILLNMGKKSPKKTTTTEVESDPTDNDKKIEELQETVDQLSKKLEESLKGNEEFRKLMSEFMKENKIESKNSKTQKTQQTPNENKSMETEIIDVEKETEIKNKESKEEEIEILDRTKKDSNISKNLGSNNSTSKQSTENQRDSEEKHVDSNERNGKTKIEFHEKKDLKLIPFQIKK